MIVKDEELALPRVLKVAPIFADEIIIVDTGSTDRTIELAEKAGCKVYHFDWINDFAAARNYSLSLGTGDYLMWLDADDIITPERAQMIASLKRSLTADVVMLPYHMGNPPSLVFWRERIIKRNMGLQFKGKVHEAIEVRGNVIYENIPVVHDKLKQSDPKRNLKLFEEILAQNGDFTGREAFYYGSELYYNGINDKADLYLRKFLKQSGSPADKGQAALYLSCIQESTQEKRKVLIEGLSFVFSPDLLCALGDSYLNSNNYHHAKACYLTALAADETITFKNPDCSGYLPHIRLCYCYWYLDDRKKAKLHNDAALKIKPDDKYALTNAKLFN